MKQSLKKPRAQPHSFPKLLKYLGFENLFILYKVYLQGEASSLQHLLTGKIVSTFVYIVRLSSVRSRRSKRGFYSVKIIRLNSVAIFVLSRNLMDVFIFQRLS